MKKYSDFGDLCATVSPSAAWVHDMSRRSGEPALFTYLVDTACLLATGRKALDVSFERSGDGLAIIPVAQSDLPSTSESLVLLMLRFFENRLTVNGNWRPDMVDIVVRSCPEISNAPIGQSVPQSLAGLWSLPMLGKRWMPAPERIAGLERGVDHVVSPR